MFNIEDILSGKFSSYPEDVQEFMKKYAEKLRETLKEELIRDITDRMLKDIDKSKDYFINTLTEILDNGCKGFDKMSTRTLLNMYLEKKSGEDFANLLDSVGKAME